MSLLAEASAGLAEQPGQHPSISAYLLYSIRQHASLSLHLSVMLSSLRAE